MRPRHDIATETSGMGFLRFLRRRAVEIATVLYLLTIIYNSLVPLDFSTEASESAASPGYVLGLPVTRAPVSDAASNVGFYVPLGVLLCATLVRAGCGRWFAIVPTLLFGAGLSYLMEYAQLWSVVRISTVYDCVYNVAGLTTGAVVSRPTVLIAGHFAHKLREELKTRPTPVLTAFFGFGLVMAALLPMDITFSMNRLEAAVKNAHVIPFEKIQNLDQISRWEGETDAFMAGHIRLRNWWMLALDYATWSVLYAVLALTACYYLRTYCRLGVIQATLHALGMCAIYSVASSALQLFVMSRGLDTTVVIFQMGGALLGTLLQFMVLNRVSGWGTMLSPLGSEQAKPLLVLGLTVVIVGVMLREIAPLRFETSQGSVAAQIERIDWLPMGAYQTAKFHHAVDDLVRKVLRFAVLGALLATAGSLKGTLTGKTSTWRIGACVALAVAVLEVLQILLPPRVPGVTDVLLAWFGATAGAHLGCLGRIWWQETQPVSAEAGVRIDYRVELGEPDDEAAPRERVPKIERRER